MLQTKRARPTKMSFFFVSVCRFSWCNQVRYSCKVARLSSFKVSRVSLSRSSSSSHRQLSPLDRTRFLHAQSNYDCHFKICLYCYITWCRIYFSFLNTSSSVTFVSIRLRLALGARFLQSGFKHHRKPLLFQIIHGCSCYKAIDIELTKFSSDMLIFFLPHL